ncbi:MAG: V-type ATP synthase subunit D [Spirochaetia bacterium]
MAAIKLTKNELKKQKDQLKMFKRYLPTLMLKKQQLQAEIWAAERELAECEEAYNALLKEFDQWVGVFGEPLPMVDGFFKLAELKIERGNVAGVSIPIYQSARFEAIPYDLFLMPVWVDKASVCMQNAMEYDIRVRVAQKKVELLRYELRVTTQRVNLFEKVKIPEGKENIRKISVYLGDAQTAEVVRGKMSKKKLENVGA